MNQNKVDYKSSYHIVCMVFFILFPDTIFSHFMTYFCKWNGRQSFSGWLTKTCIYQIETYSVPYYWIKSREANSIFPVKTFWQETAIWPHTKYTINSPVKKCLYPRNCIQNYITIELFLREARCSIKAFSKYSYVCARWV